MVSSPTRNRLNWLAIACLVILAAWVSLRRVQEGELFLFRLPIDREPFDFELQDASATARIWNLPALLFLAVAALATLAVVRAGPLESARSLRRRLGSHIKAHAILCPLFFLACLADLVSTLWYFHEYSVEDELHPGIKLVTYAWGLSVGCAAAKLIQAVLVLLVCTLVPRIARLVLVFATVGYAVAAAWNFGFF
jgi:hypothetical protein